VPFTDAERDELVDVVGTGGGGPLTFNISSGAALVAAAAGAKSSQARQSRGHLAVRRGGCTGSAGRAIELEPELAAACLRETGFMFLFAPLYHPADEGSGALRRRWVSGPSLISAGR